MENFSYHVPVFVVNAGVATSGHSADLAGGQVGLFDRATWSVATSTGNGTEMFFAQGNIGGKDWYGYPITETSHKSPMFYAKDVENIYLSRPQRKQNEEWIIGYNGAASSKGIRYFKEAEPVKIKFLFTGGPTYRYFGGPKEYVVSLSPDVDCTTPCSGDCTDSEVDPVYHVKKHIDLINNHTELRKFGVKAGYISSAYSATSTNMEKFQLSVCDNGDGVALNAVKAQYPSLTVNRVSRLGTTSVYEVCVVSTVGDDTPASFTQTGSVKLAVCGSCTNVAGSVLSPAQDVYMIRRVLASDDALSTVEDRLSFAQSVAFEYFGATFNSTSGINASTETITSVAHGFSEGQAVTFTPASGLIVGGLTEGTTYYVIAAGLTADTFRVSEERGGTAVDLTAAVGTTTVAPASTSFLAQDGAVALIKVYVPAGTTVEASGSDSVEFSHTEAASCELSAPDPIDWVATGTGIRGKRTMKINQLQRPSCDADGDRLADLELILAGVEGIDLETLELVEGDACHDDYTVEQWSIDCLSEEACQTNEVTFHYASLPTIDNQSWTEDVASPAGSPFTVSVGMRITADYEDIRFGNDSFDKSDYYETAPLKMEVSVWREWASNCDASLFPSVVQTKYGAYERQSGEWVVREVICKTDAYQKHINQFSDSPRMREAFDMNLLNMVDRKAFYNLYYVTFYASYGKLWRKPSVPEKFTAVFAFKEDDPRQETFKTNVLNVLTAKSGVPMHING